MHVHVSCVCVCVCVCVPVYACLSELLASPYRFLRLNHRYRDILWTLAYIAPKMVTVGIFLALVYYAFAIIGVEFLNGKVFEGCW